MRGALVQGDHSQQDFLAVRDRSVAGRNSFDLVGPSAEGAYVSGDGPALPRREWVKATYNGQNAGHICYGWLSAVPEWPIAVINP